MTKEVEGLQSSMVQKQSSVENLSQDVLERQEKTEWAEKEMSSVLWILDRQKNGQDRLSLHNLYYNFLSTALVTEEVLGNKLVQMLILPKARGQSQ